VKVLLQVRPPRWKGSHEDPRYLDTRFDWTGLLQECDVIVHESKRRVTKELLREHVQGRLIDYLAHHLNQVFANTASDVADSKYEKHDCAL
jgi:hypothetical protein